MSDEIAYYISRKEFKRRMRQMNISITKSSIQYSTELIREESKPNPSLEYVTWLKDQMKELAIDHHHNVNMIQRADIETGHLLFWLDGLGNLSMRRCSGEEYDKIYNRKGNMTYCR